MRRIEAFFRFQVQKERGTKSEVKAPQRSHEPDLVLKQHLHNKKRQRMLWFLLLPIIGLLILRVGNAQVPRPTTLGVHDGALAPCPDMPNCVSSRDLRAAWRIEPLVFTGTPSAAKRDLENALNSMKGSRLIQNSNSYLHYEFRTPLFGFVDDLEFLCDETNKTFHVRSASRIGHSDLGTNRNRVEDLRARLNWR